MSHVDALIRDLSRDLQPVERLRSPLRRAALWLGLVAAIAVALCCFADLDATAARLRAAPDMWMGTLGSCATAVLAAVAAFELSLPDRRAAWALLPLPTLALWLGASGFGCLRPWILPGLSPADGSIEPSCFAFIVGFSVPLSIAMVLMIRRACPLRPNLAAATGGLAVAAASASLLVLFHDHDASVSDLAVHVVAVAVVVGVNQLVGGRLLDSRKDAGQPLNVRPAGTARRP